MRPCAAPAVSDRPGGDDARRPPAAAQISPAEPPAATIPAIEWANLPELILVRHTEPSPSMARFVRDEVAAGRCAAAQRGAEGFTLHVELGVLIGRGGELRRIVPRAIGCPTVEQYSAGIISRMARANVASPGVDTWYRTSIDFVWKE